MKVTTRHAGNVVVAELVGEIDTVDTEGLGEAFGAIVAEKPGGLVLDFSGVNYIASMGLSLLLNLAREMRKAKSPLVIAAVTPAVKTVLDTVHLGAAIPLEATVENALTRAQKAA
jgi:anti-sigma B factor antagonist